MIKILKICVQKIFNFRKKFENAQKNIMKSATFIFVLSYFPKRRCSQKKPQLKVEIEDGCEAP